MIPPSLERHIHRFPKFPSKPERLTKRGRMTIAIGMLCQGGLVIAADTQMTSPDDTTYDAVKVQTLTTPTGGFALAYSCYDVNAAETLVTDIVEDLRLVEPKSLAGFESTIKNQMSEWSKLFTVKDDRPGITIIAGARINPSEFGLYLCEPPGTVVRKTLANSDGYVATGLGQAITDPMFRTLFGPAVPPRVCLAQLSYLMYRAKKDCRGACGGETDAVLLSEEYQEPMWIERAYMKRAEEYGKSLDETLAHVTSAIFSRTGFDDKSRFGQFFDPKTICGTFGLLGFGFRARTGEMIRESEFQKMMDNPSEYLDR